MIGCVGFILACFIEPLRFTIALIKIMPWWIWLAFIMVACIALA